MKNIKSFLGNNTVLFFLSFCVWHLYWWNFTTFILLPLVSICLVSSYVYGRPNDYCFCRFCMKIWFKFQKVIIRTTWSYLMVSFNKCWCDSRLHWRFSSGRFKPIRKYMQLNFFQCFKTIQDRETKKGSHTCFSLVTSTRVRNSPQLYDFYF